MKTNGFRRWLFVFCPITLVWSVPCAFADPNRTEVTRVCYVNWTPQHWILVDREPDAERIGRASGNEMVTPEEADARDEAFRQGLRACRDEAPAGEEYRCNPLPSPHDVPVYAVTARAVGEVEPYSTVCEAIEPFDYDVDGQSFPAVTCSFDGFRQKSGMSDSFRERYEENWDDDRSESCDSIALSGDELAISDGGSATFSFHDGPPGLRSVGVLNSGLNYCASVQEEPCLRASDPEFDAMLESIAAAEATFAALSPGD